MLTSSASHFRYLLTLIAIVVLAGGLGFTAVRLRRRWLADMDGPLAVLSSVVIAVILLVLESQILGTFGLFKLLPLMLATVVIALAAWRWCHPALGAASAEDPQETTARAENGVVTEGGVATQASVVTEASVATHTEAAGRVHFWQQPSAQQWALGLALIACGATLAKWLQPTLQSYSTGAYGWDTLWYHGPFAAQFVQTGWTSHILSLDIDYYNRFYPATSELVHAVGILVFGYDTLSPGMNVIWVALTLLATYCIGASYKLGPWTLLAGATVAATPMLTASDAGTLDNDVMALFFLIAAIAIYPDLQARRDGDLSWARVTLAALTAGIAISIKPTTWVAVGVLTLGAIVIAPRHRHWRTTGVWVAGLFVGGSYWYLRNLVSAGNPMPSLHLPLFAKPPMALSENIAYSVSHFFGQPLMSRLIAELGKAADRYWAWLLAVAAAGAVLALFTHERRTRLIAAVALIAGVAYVVTPDTASGYGGPLWNFYWSVRYIAGPVLLGLMLLPTVPAFRRRVWRRVTFAVLGCLYVLMLIGANPWPIPILTESLCALGLLLLVAAIRLLRPRLRTVPGIAICVVVAAVAIVGVRVGQRRYLTHRYTHADQAVEADRTPLTQIYARVQKLSHARIALAGTYVAEQRYPLYGRAFTNQLDYITWTGSDDTLHEYRHCENWLKALNAGHYDYLIVSPGGTDDHQVWQALAARWIKPGPHARILLHYVVGGKRFTLWRLKGAQPLDICAKIPADWRTIPPIKPIKPQPYS